MRKYETGIDPGKCGIYGIKYNELGIVYVGQAKDIRSRLESHNYNSCKIGKSESVNKSIDRFMGEKGWENFEFVILKECSLEDLDYYEQYYYEKYGAEKLKNAESPKIAAVLGITCYSMPGFLNSRVAFYGKKLIEEDNSFSECVRCLSLDYINKEKSLKENWIRRFRCNSIDIDKYRRDSNNHKNAIEAVCGSELKSYIEKVYMIANQENTCTLINRETGMFINEKKAEKDIVKQFNNDIRIGNLSLKRLNYQLYYDRKVVEQYFTIAELSKVVTKYDVLK